MNVDQIDIPKASGLTEKSYQLVKTGKWFRQEKADGERRILVKHEDGSIGAYGVRFSDVTGHRENVIHRLGSTIRSYTEKMRPGDVIDGEVVTPSGCASDVKTLMKVDSPLLQYRVFGVLWFEGLQCLSPIEAIPRLLREVGLEHLWMPITQIDTNDGFRQFMEWNLAMSAGLGTEGWILKKTNMRPWFKIKRRKTYDLVVMDITDAKWGVTGKYNGLIGALVCGAFKDGVLTEICQCSGMSDEARKEFTNHPPIGEVVEVEAQFQAAKGRLRHPQFKRLRPDKSAAACLWPTKETA